MRTEMPLDAASEAAEQWDAELNMAIAIVLLTSEKAAFALATAGSEGV